MKTIYTLSQNFGTMYKKLLLILCFRILINVWSVLCYTPLLLGGGGTLWWSKIVIGFTGLKTACILIEQPNGLALWIAIEDKYYSTNFMQQLFDLWNLQNIKLLFEIRSLSTCHMALDYIRFVLINGIWQRKIEITAWPPISIIFACLVPFRAQNLWLRGNIKRPNQISCLHIFGKIQNSNWNLIEKLQRETMLIFVKPIFY